MSTHQSTPSDDELEPEPINQETVILNVVKGVGTRALQLADMIEQIIQEFAIDERDLEARCRIFQYTLYSWGSRRRGNRVFISRGPRPPSFLPGSDYPEPGAEFDHKPELEATIPLIDRETVLLMIAPGLMTRELQLIDLLDQIFRQFLPEERHAADRQRILCYHLDRWTSAPERPDPTAQFMATMEKMMNRSMPPPNIPGADDDEAPAGS